MLRLSRLGFLLFGLLPLLDVLALLLYGLQASTRGRPGEGGLVPAIVVLAVLMLLVAVVGAIGRGRDFGYSTGRTLIGLAFATALFPLLLPLLGYLAFAPGRGGSSSGARLQAGPARSPGPFALAFGLALLALPWLILRLLLAIG